MRILFLVPYLANNSIPTFSKSKGGFGYMVSDIMRAVAKYETVSAFVYRYQFKGFCYDNVHYLTKSYWLYLKYLYKALPLSSVISLYRKYHMSWYEVVLLLYVWFQTGYLKHIIQNGNFDVVHCHGCGFSNNLYIKLFNLLEQKYIFTLHGLNSFSDSIHIEEACKRCERDFLNEVRERIIPLTVISTGIKQMIANALGVIELNNIFVVTNACSISSCNSKQYIDIRAKFGLPVASKVILYVGNISYNKNQQQMIESFELMPSCLCENTFILFLGRDIEPGYEVGSLIRSSKYPEHLILCGNVDKELMENYYEQSDGVALLSHEEGFGLSLIEGMQFGLPCIAHKDMYAYEDIYDSKAMIGINDRTNESVALALEALLTTKWDKNSIVKYAEKFGMESMANQYIDCYKKVIYG